MTTIRAFLLSALLGFGLEAATVSQVLIQTGGGQSATVTADAVGTLACAGACGGLIFSGAGGGHGTIQINGSIGQFKLNIVAVGRNNLGDALANLQQINTATGGAGTLAVQFTDTGYTALNRFIIGAATVNDTGLVDSTTDFTFATSPFNAIPANVTVAFFRGLTALSDSALEFLRAPFTHGSLTVGTVMQFTRRGALQASASISTDNGGTKCTATPSAAASPPLLP